jgi:hypothetical protein
MFIIPWAIMLAHVRLSHPAALSKQHAGTGSLSGNSSNRHRASPSACLPRSTAPLRLAFTAARSGRPAEGQHVGLSVVAAGGRGEAGAAPIRHCKGVNDLDKVVLREVRGSSTEVPVCHSRSVVCACPVTRV